MSQDTEQIKQSLSNLLAPRKPKEPKPQKVFRIPEDRKLEKVGTFNKKKKKKFIEVLSETANFLAACRAVDISKSVAYRHVHQDEWFRQEVLAAREESINNLEEEVYRRAYFGTEKPVFHKGKEVGVITEYSNDLAMFILKAARPDIYAGKSQVEISGPDGSAIQISETKGKLLTLLNLTPEEIIEENPQPT